MKINKKIPVLHIISLSFIVFPVLSFTLFGHGNKVAEAITNPETDMSNIELLSGESFDNSHIIYDDFSGNNLTDNWLISHRKWGGYDNKGVSADNVYLDTANDKVIIKALGNQHVATQTVNGVGGPLSGGALVLKETARPGRYETRFKAAYKVGVCNAFWTYTENSQGENHEIDIEFPFKDNSGNNVYNEVIFTNYIGESNFQQTHTTLDYYLNDGEYHTYAFDWYYSSGHKEIRYYIDAHLLATHKVSSQLPFLPSRLWLGCWIPNNPYFVGVPDFDECFMEIDYFKYSPFANQESVTKGNAGGCGATSVNYHIQSAGFEKYDWISNGSFHSINKTDSLEDRGYQVNGTVRLYNGFDHVGASNSGGLKMNPGAEVSYKVDSTYKDYEYTLSTFYKGDGTIKLSFFDKNNTSINTLSIVLPHSDYWTKIKYPFVVPANSFYTVVSIKANSQELYIDDLSMVLGADKPVEEVALLSIYLSGPNKTTYKIGESLDLTGLVVTGIYSDGKERIITDYHVSEVDMSTSGTKVVTITKGEQSASFNIVVDEEGHSSASLVSIAVEGTYKTEYKVGEEIDFTGLIVKATYSDGSSKEITNYQINKPDTSTSGYKRVTIIYIDKIITFNILVSEKSVNTSGCGGSLVATSLVLSISSVVGLLGLAIKKRKEK